MRRAGGRTVDGTQVIHNVVLANELHRVGSLPGSDVRIPAGQLCIKPTRRCYEVGRVKYPHGVAALSCWRNGKACE